MGDVCKNPGNKPVGFLGLPDLKGRPIAARFIFIVWFVTLCYYFDKLFMIKRQGKATDLRALRCKDVGEKEDMKAETET